MSPKSVAISVTFSATIIIIIVACNAFEFWNDLRVTWGPLPTIGYDRLPRNVIDAVKDGWVQQSTDCFNNGAFNGFRYTYPADYGIALLYDVHGNVGGIQSLVPHSHLDVVGQTFRFDRVSMYQNHTINGVTYYVVTVYFTVPTKLCNNSAPEESGNIGPSSLVYFQNGPSPSDLKVAYKSRTDASLNGWALNECVPGMGWHSFFEVDRWESYTCNEVQPTCLLYNEFDQLIGVCLVYPGNATQSTRFEHPTSAALDAVLGDVPQCFLNQTDRIGSTTVHLYFTNTPWSIGC